MPYIEERQRDQLLPVADRYAFNPGQLNFQITSLLNEYIEGSSGLSYQVINDILGALEGAKLEFYRRVAVPYEKTKIKANGDVYTVNG